MKNENQNIFYFFGKINPISEPNAFRMKAQQNKRQHLFPKSAAKYPTNILSHTRAQSSSSQVFQSTTWWCQPVQHFPGPFATSPWQSLEGIDSDHVRN